MGHTLKNGSNLLKWVTLGEMGHTLKKGSYLKKWVTFRKKVTFGKNDTLKTFFTLGKN